MLFTYRTLPFVISNSVFLHLKRLIFWIVVSFCAWLQIGIPSCVGFLILFYLYVETVCPILIRPLDGVIKFHNTKLGSSASFQCNVGYNMSGSARVTCQLHGLKVQWSDEPPVCHCKSIGQKLQIVYLDY